MNISPPNTPKSPIKVALVEDRPDLRESWNKLIGSFNDFTCICSCASGEEALRVIPTAAPDVVIMDIFLPRMSGIECTARLKELLPQALILILTAVDDDELVFMALEAGADGYLLKRAKPAELRQALLEVVNGGAPMSSEIARRVVHSFRQKPKASREPDAVRLSAREEEVLILLSRGFANKEIADHLHVSTDTVRSHLKHIYEKMHVRSRTEAVARFMGSKAGG